MKLPGFEDGVAPCHYAFLSLDGDALSRVPGTFAPGEAKGGHIVIGGKTLSGLSVPAARETCAADWSKPIAVVIGRAL